MTSMTNKQGNLFAKYLNTSQTLQFNSLEEFVNYAAADPSSFLPNEIILNGQQK